MSKFYKCSLLHQQAPICHTCYGFSNWTGDKEAMVYEDRDCTSCNVNPDIYPEFARKDEEYKDKDHDGLTR